MEATVNLLGTDILEYTANGDLPPRPGNRSRDYCPHGAYRCAGEDRWCAIAVASDEDWRLLCAAIDRPELAADERVAPAEARRADEDAIDDLRTAGTRDRDAWGTGDARPVRRAVVADEVMSAVARHGGDESGGVDFADAIVAAVSNV